MTPYMMNEHVAAVERRLEAKAEVGPMACYEGIPVDRLSKRALMGFCIEAVGRMQEQHEQYQRDMSFFGSLRRGQR
ncbi:MAG: hypothetical protein GY851_09360 [bacterium]|nr:hypothetical protein [bacterium]